MALRVRVSGLELGIEFFPPFATSTVAFAARRLKRSSINRSVRLLKPDAVLTDVQDHSAATISIRRPIQRTWTLDRHRVAERLVARAVRSGSAAHRNGCVPVAGRSPVAARIRGASSDEQPSPAPRRPDRRHSDASHHGSCCGEWGRFRQRRTHFSPRICYRTQYTRSRAAGPIRIAADRCRQTSARQHQYWTRVSGN